MRLWVSRRRSYVSNPGKERLLQRERTNRRTLSCYYRQNRAHKERKLTKERDDKHWVTRVVKYKRKAGRKYMEFLCRIMREVIGREAFHDRKELREPFLERIHESDEWFGMLLLEENYNHWWVEATRPTTVSNPVTVELGFFCRFLARTKNASQTLQPSTIYRMPPWDFMVVRSFNARFI
jgi:hypothetical protein